MADEIKSESEVNAAAEDTEIKTEVESVLQDTVEWVESTRTPIGEEGSLYIEVKKSRYSGPFPVGQPGLRPVCRRAGRTGSSLLTDGGVGQLQRPQTLTESPEDTEPPEPAEPSSAETGGEAGGTPPAESTDPEPQTVAVTGVSASPASLSGNRGRKRERSSVTVSPDNASDRSVSFSSDNGGVAERGRQAAM